LQFSQEFCLNLNLQTLQNWKKPYLLKCTICEQVKRGLFGAVGHLVAANVPPSTPRKCENAENIELWICFDRIFIELA
jgi:hypothetical protein